MITRRGLFFGTASALGLLAAPSIVRAASLMPVSVPRSDLSAALFKDFNTRMLRVSIRDRDRHHVRAFWEISEEMFRETGRIHIPETALPAVWDRRQVRDIVGRLQGFARQNRDGIVMGPRAEGHWPAPVGAPVGVYVGV